MEAVAAKRRVNDEAISAKRSRIKWKIHSGKSRASEKKLIEINFWKNNFLFIQWLGIKYMKNYPENFQKSSKYSNIKFHKKIRLKIIKI